MPRNYYSKQPRQKGKELINAVPKAYNGVQYKSTSEANLAKILDESELPWSYESQDCKINLVPKFEFQGEKIREMNYTGDFSVISPKGKRFLIEVKGRFLETFILKQKWIKYVIWSQNLDIHYIVVSNIKEMWDAVSLIRRS